MRVTIPGKVYERFIKPSPWSLVTSEIRERKDGSRSYVYEVSPETAELMAKTLLRASDEWEQTIPYQERMKLGVWAPREARLVVGRIHRDMREQARRSSSKKAC